MTETENESRKDIIDEFFFESVTDGVQIIPSIVMALKDSNLDIRNAFSNEFDYLLGYFHGFVYGSFIDKCVNNRINMTQEEENEITTRLFTNTERTRNLLIQQQGA